MTQGRDGERGTASALARTVPSDSAKVDELASADTMLAPEATRPPPIALGEVLASRYRILGELGRGGEGVVFRALDLRADAVVALKLLERDPARLGRYRRELQMARRVTHPNVVRIHDIVDLPGRFGLSMELIDGEPLDARLARTGPLPVGEVSRLALDLARALAAAHAAGVTHRDLKPANVILRAGGKGAVVTDFGVAREHAPVDPPLSATPSGAASTRLTIDGALVGTPLYMAPEQLEGQSRVGPAADVYAFGLLVREAATGERLHGAAASLADLRDARARAIPSLASVRPEAPALLVAVVDRCLSVDPARRYADGEALLVALGGASSLPPPVARRSWRFAAASLGALGAAALVALAPWSDRRAPAAVVPPPEAPSVPAAIALRAEGIRRLTFDEGCEEFPAFSPDGATLAFDGNLGRASHVFTMPAAGGEPRALTHEDGVWDLAAAYSPDGTRIAFLRLGDGKAATYVIGVDGKGERRITGGSLRPAWSPDGKSIWAGGPKTVRRHDVETGAVLETRSISEGTTVLNARQVGDALVVVMPENDVAGRPGVAVLDAEGPERWLLDGDFEEVVALAPGGAHVLVSRVRTNTGMELLALPLEGGPPVSLATSGIEPRKGVTVAPGGARVVWSTCQVRDDMVRANARDVLEPLQARHDWDEMTIAGMPGSTDLLALSTRTGPVTPWIVDPEGREAARAVPYAGPEPNAVAVSADRARLVLGTREGLRAVTVDGSAPVRALTKTADDASPALTRDGRSVLFVRQVGTGPSEILSVPWEGGEPRVITQGLAVVASPVDDRIVYLAGEKPEVVVRRRDLVTGRDAPVSAALGTQAFEELAIAPDGARILVMSGERSILEVDLASGRVLRTVRSDADLDALTYRGKSIYAIRTRWVGGLWAADTRWETR